MVEVLEHRAEWEAAFRGGWLKHFQDSGKIDWKLYNRPRNAEGVPGKGIDLRWSRIMLISSAGGYLPKSQQPFDDTNDLGDYGIRLIPVIAPLRSIAYAHTHYDQTAVKSDPQVLLPLNHLDGMVAEGRVGSLTDHVVSFMGYQPDVSRVLDETIPAIVEAAKRDGADGALLVPS